MDWVSKPYQQFPGSVMAESQVYQIAVGKDHRIWLWPVDGNPDMTHVSGGPGSAGYGGRVLQFNLAVGGVLHLIGPWNSNPESLFSATGVDLRNNFMTRMVIGKGRKISDVGWRTIITDVLHEEIDFTKGSYDRGVLIAQGLAEKMGCTLLYHIESFTGSSSGPVYPLGDLIKVDAL